MGYEIIDRMFEGEHPKSIFEIGVANGFLLKEYCMVNNIPSVNGMDIKLFEGFTLNYPEGQFFLHDVKQVPWPVPDNSYDIVCDIGTLLLIPNPYPVIKEMLRICKDKIILAENQDEKQDDYGLAHNTQKNEYVQMEQSTPQDIDFYAWRISRDYKKVFKKLGKTIEVIGKVSDKTIFKCLK